MMPRPNIVIVMSDQHNARVMGCAGNAIVQTPNLDALAGRGIQFTSAYCPYPLCVPARMGFMTAQYPSTVRVWDNPSRLSSDVPTFAHALGAGGYEAVLCGRMHFADPDQFHGFEKRLVGDCHDCLSPAVQGTGDCRTNGQTAFAVEMAGYGRTGFQAFDRAVTDEACRFIAARTPRDRPYALVVGYILPHNPLICERGLFEHYLAALPPPAWWTVEPPHGANPAIRAWRTRRGADRLTPAQHRRGLAAYYGLVSELDRNVGRLMSAVTASAGAARTLVVYCSDHGDMAGEHGMWWKSCHFEGAARVPLIVAGPAGVAAPRRVPAVVSLIDVGPTVLELTGCPPLPDVAGRALAPVLRAGEPPPDWPHEIFCEYIGAHGDAPSCMIRRGDWKLMLYPEFETCLLFNLKDDPDEVHDRAADPACAALVQELSARIRARWNPADMLAGYAREQRARAVLRDCGHPPIPHPVSHYQPPAGANEFDVAQLDPSAGAAGQAGARRRR